MAFRNSLNENEKNRQLLYLRNSFAAAGKNALLDTYKNPDENPDHALGVKRVVTLKMAF